MPFIDARVTGKLTEEKREIIKDKLSDAIVLMHKQPSHLMIGFVDGYELYFAGEKLKYGAFVEVSTFTSPRSEDCEKMTAAICEILSEELGIPADAVYVKYHGVDDWGWNGTNF